MWRRWAAQKVEWGPSTPRQGLRNHRRRGRPCTSQPLLPGRKKLNGRAAPEARMDGNAFHGNAPRTGPDVTVGLAPATPPSEH